MPRSPDATDAEVGRLIAARRTALGLSQSVLAQRVGTSYQQIQKYEVGANRISASRLSKVAAALGVAPGALFPDRSEDEATVQARSADLGLRFMTATPEGRAVAQAFPLIPDRAVRQALARIVQGLAPQA